MASSKVHSPSSAPPHNGFSLISNDKLLQIYSTMLKSRMLRARIRTLGKHNGSAGPMVAAGMESIAAGVVLDLFPGDTLAPSPGDFIPCFVKGLSLTQIISALSPESAAIRPRYGSLKLVSPSLSLRVQLDRAIAAARANKAARNKKIAVAFCGDSSRSMDLLQEAMRQVGRLNLPILLVCRNGAHATEIRQDAEACGFPGVTVDGGDAVAIYRVATEAMAHARRGSGPTLIECRPWAPAGPASRTSQKTGNPILKMEKYLAAKGLFDPKFKSAVTRDFRRELDSAFQSLGGA